MQEKIILDLEADYENSRKGKGVLWHFFPSRNKLISFGNVLSLQAPTWMAVKICWWRTRIIPGTMKVTMRTLTSRQIENIINLPIMVPVR